MAFTVTGRGSTEATYSTGGNVGDVFTPAENDIILLIINSSSNTAPSAVTGWGATWGTVAGSPFSSFDHYVHVYAARIGASPSSGQANITVNSSSFCASVIQIAGASTAGAAESVVVQTSHSSVYGATSPHSIPALNTFTSATNLSLTINARKANLDFTTPTGWTLAEQTNSATTDFQTAIFYKDSEDTTHTIEGPSFTYAWVSGVAMEIAEAAAGGASITDVDTDNILTDGQTGVVANISGFTTPPDSGKLVSGAFEYALTNFSSNATTATFDIQDIANLSSSQAGVPFSSASHSLTLVLENSVDVESASIAITLNPATGRAVQEVTGVNNATNGCVTKNFTGTPPNTSQIAYETASNTSLDAQALLTTDIINGTINMRYWDAVTGLWEPFTVTLVNGVITSYSVPRMIARSKRLTNVIKRIQNAQEI